MRASQAHQLTLENTLDKKAKTDSSCAAAGPAIRVYKKAKHARVIAQGIVFFRRPDLLMGASGTSSTLLKLDS
jgi:hypothetical protein